MRDRRRRGEQGRQPNAGAQGRAGPAAGPATQGTLGLSEVGSGKTSFVSPRSAQLHVLFEGYVAGERVASTVSYIREGDVRVVVDPGMVPDVARAILDPLARLGESPTSITDVVLTHHHPDHTLNAGLFLGARVHDHWAWYQGDLWVDRAAEGFGLSPSVVLIETPGHTAEDITVLAGTPDGIVALTHLWWTADGPAEDPHAADPEALHRGRGRVLDMASLVVPGHGAAFAPDENTPR